MPNHHKLARDRIPEIIRGSGRACEVEVLSPDAYARALRSKLVEEAQEAAEASDGELIVELADLLEVLESLAVASGIAWEALRQVQQERRRERGGFTRRLWLVWSD